VRFKCIVALANGARDGGFLRWSVFDVIFLRNPAVGLRELAGFIAACNTSWWNGAASPSGRKESWRMISVGHA
jgi:hypothetical protein